MDIQQAAQATVAAGHSPVSGWVWGPCVGWIVVVTLITSRIFHGSESESLPSGATSEDILGATRKANRKAILEVVFWLAHSVLVGIAFWVFYGGEVAGQFFAGWTVENALSVDNILIWAVVLTYFGVPNQYRPRLLAWGVYGAIILRAGFILAGLSLIHACEIVMLPLGLYLIWTAYKVSQGDDGFKAEEHWLIRLFQRRGWVSQRLDGAKFFTYVRLEAVDQAFEADTTSKAKRVMTKLFVVMVILEFVDLLFAFDSIPVGILVAKSALVVWMSNMCAVLGLRALFYVYTAIEHKLWALGYGVTVVLIWIGVTTFLQPGRLSPLPWKWVGLNVPILVNLAIIAGVLLLSVLWGLIRPKSDENTASSPSRT